MKVLFTVPIKEEQFIDFKSQFPEIQFFMEKEPSQARDEILKDVEILVSYGFDINQEDIQKAKKLQWIMVYSAGVDKLPKEEIIARDIVVTNVKGIHKHVIAEQVFAYMLSSERKLNEYFDLQEEAIWDRKLRPQSLYGKNIGIIGVGAIGREIARKAKVFDMHVLGIRQTPKPTEYVDEIFPIQELYTVLSRSDFVVMVLPATEETKYIMNEEAFKHMKKDSFFVNIARGDVVDTNALIKAVNEKMIAGAALDVFEEEPLPKEHPLWTLKNVMITPHTAGLFPDYNVRSNDVFNHNLKVYINKEGTTKNIVDMQKGY